jgi:hypothetical protein
MTYAINGVALDNPSKGWTLARGSIPVLPLEYAATNYTTAGRDGDFQAARPTRRPASFRFIVKAGLATRQELLSVFSMPELSITSTELPGYTAIGYLLTSDVEEYHEARGWAKDLFIIEVPSGNWRGVVETTTLKPAVPTSAVQSIFPGLGAPVQDAILRIKGPIQNPQITDSSGAFFTLGATIAAGNFLRFDSQTGRAWLTTTDTWSGGTELSNQIDYGGPRGVFEITPIYGTPGIPSTRVGKLTLTQASYNTGSGFQVRAAAAVLL